MKSGLFTTAACLAAGIFIFSFTASAEEAAPCSERVTRSSLIPCVLRVSLVIRAEHHELQAAEGRKTAISPLLPSNPVLSVSGSRRTAPGSETHNWSASLAQEIEIAGQRGARRAAADAELDAQRKRIVLFQREVAASAWIAFFETLAAQQERDLAIRLARVTQQVSVVAQARADKGLIAPIDADVAEASAVRVLRAKLAADRRLSEAKASLASLLGLDPARAALRVEGDLVPIAGVDGVAPSVASRPAAERPELQVFDAERQAFERRASAFRRARVPNPILSVFAENDGFNEHVLGLGVSLPIPLPGNVGRTHIGEIVEAEALARRAATNRERVRRELQLAMFTAITRYESLDREVRAVSAEKAARAYESLRSLGEEVEAGRLSVRDAVVAQQALVELLSANVAARKAWCLASVDLARALGVPLERGVP